SIKKCRACEVQVGRCGPDRRDSRTFPSTHLEGTGAAVKMLRWSALVAAVVAGASLFAGDSKPAPREESSFRVLQGADAGNSRKQAEAWLKAVRNDTRTMASFTKLWQTERPVLDRVAATLALGDADAGRLLNQVKDGAPPTEVPA